MAKNFFLLLVITICVSGCLFNKPCNDMQFERLSNTNRILITDNMNRELLEISVSDQIGRIVAFAQSHDSGWETPWAGTPIAKIRANFYVGDAFLGNLGLGSTFMTAQGCGYFQSRGVNVRERQVLLGLFGVADPYSSE